MTEDTNLFMDDKETLYAPETFGDTDPEAEGPMEAAPETMVRCVFLGREILLPPSEAALWAQKGMNAEYAMERQNGSKERELLDFYAAQKGMDRQAFMDYLEKRKLKALTEADIETIGREHPEMPRSAVLKTAELKAQKRLEEYERGRALQAQREKAQSYAPWERLLAYCPEITGCDSLPEGTPQLIESGCTPLEAVLTGKLKAAQAEIGRLNAALAARQKNQSNIEKSVGSALGYGQAQNLDPFLMGMLKAR